MTTSLTVSLKKFSNKRIEEEESSRVVVVMIYLERYDRVVLAS